MMDWTDRHCRYFHRLMSRSARLYTEMVVDQAILHGDLQRHLGFSPSEHPLAVQLGGSVPADLAVAARRCADWGYDEINLNVGCPSDRVQSGTFGACLMRQPQLVGACVAAMKDAVGIPVTVKCRIGVDDQNPQTALDDLAGAVFDNGCDGLWVHARMAWLEGLSPAENRDIPPLDYDRVYRLKQDHPGRFIGINGGIADLQQAEAHLAHVDGVMLGRAAYHTPDILGQVDRRLFGSKRPPPADREICAQMMDYARAHLSQGGRVSHVTRHMLGLFRGQPGARRYRQIMTVEAARPDADETVIERAFAAVLQPRDVLPALA